MTDRVRSLTVLLDRDYRDDEAEMIANCIRTMRAVADVQLGPVCDMDHWLAVATAKQDIRDRIWDLLDPRLEAKK